MSRPPERVVAVYNKRGMCERWIKEGKGAMKSTRLSCRTFAANAVGTWRLSCKRAGKTRTLMLVWDSSGESRLSADSARELVAKILAALASGEVEHGKAARHAGAPVAAE